MSERGWGVVPVAWVASGGRADREKPSAIDAVKRCRAFAVLVSCTFAALIGIAPTPARADFFQITYTSAGSSTSGQSVVLEVYANYISGDAGTANGLYQVTAITSGTSTQHTGTATLIPLDGSATGGSLNFGTIGHNGKKYAVDNYFRPFNTTQPFTTYQLVSGNTGFVSGADNGGIGFYFTGDNNAFLIGADNAAGTTDLELYCATRGSNCSSSQFNGALSSVSITPNPGPLPGAGLLSYLVLGFGGLAAFRKRVAARARAFMAVALAMLPARRHGRAAA